MKAHPFHYAAVLFGALLFTACADSGDATDKTNDQMRENRTEMNDARTESSEEWRNERDEAVNELRDLRSTLENRQMREQKRLDDGIKDATKKAECQAMIAELGVNMARIDASLLRMEASTCLLYTSRCV